MSVFELTWNVVLVGRGAAWADLRKGKLPDIDPTLGRSPDLIQLVSQVCDTPCGTQLNTQCVACAPLLEWAVFHVAPPGPEPPVSVFPFPFLALPDIR